MVLLHGGGADGSAWGPVVDELAVDWLVYVVDLRGHGASARTPAYSFELMRDDIAGPLQALDLRDVTLVGHSMDGIVAYLVAADLADPVTGLVMEEAPPPSPMGFPVPDHPVRGPIVSQLNELPPAGVARSDGRAAAARRACDHPRRTSGPRAGTGEFVAAIRTFTKRT